MQIFIGTRKEQLKHTRILNTTLFISVFWRKISPTKFRCEVYSHYRDGLRFNSLWKLKSISRQWQRHLTEMTWSLVLENFNLTEPPFVQRMSVSRQNGSDNIGKLKRVI